MANLSGTFTSPYTSPTFMYDISYEETGRTGTTVTYYVVVSAYMTHSTSYFGYSLNGYLNIGGVQATIISKGTTTWSGTTKHTFTKTINCNVNEDAGTVSARFWTTTPDSPGDSGKIDISGTFLKTAADGGSSPMPTVASGIYKRVGSTWKDYGDITDGITKWSSSTGTWKEATIMRRASGKWIQIYPGTSAGGSGDTTTTDGHVIVKGGVHKYKNKYDWKDGTARQGTWEDYGACYGVFGINRTQFPGNGNVTNVISAYITGKRNASGYYNSNQTIKFYRSNNSGSGTSIGYSGLFTATTGAPGPDQWMSGQRAISGLSNVRDFLNGVGGYNNLLIHSTAGEDYLGLSEVSLAIKYEYKPVVAVFDNPTFATSMSESQLENEAINNPYLTMLLYEDEILLTLDEILKRRMILNRPDLSIDSLQSVSFKLPYSRDFKVINGKMYIELFNIFENRKPQYSFDGVEWKDLNFNVITTQYEGEILKDYDFVYVRVVDEIEDNVIYEHKYDKPRIYLV